MNRDYYQAILQLRNPSQDAADFIEKELGNQISRVEKVRNGVDYYIKDKKKAEVCGRKLRDKFGGVFNVAAKLHTRDTKNNRDLYRLNILLRLPEFGKGEVIAVDDLILKITSLGKKVSGLDLKTGKKKTINYPEQFEILKRHETRVVKIHPEIEVLHPTTYQETPLENKPSKELKPNEKVKVVIKKGLWII